MHLGQLEKILVPFHFKKEFERRAAVHMDNAPLRFRAHCGDGNVSESVSIRIRSQADAPGTSKFRQPVSYEPPTRRAPDSPHLARSGIARSTRVAG